MTLRVPLLCIFAIQLASAQTPTFEVASVKPAEPQGGGVEGSCHGVDSVYPPGQQSTPPSLGRCVITNGRLSHMIGIAWDLSSMNWLKSEPDWIARGADRFNVVAKAEDPAHATEKQLHEMLQNLLVERFQMKFHRELTPEPGFALTLAKGAPKLQESKPDSDDPNVGADFGSLKFQPGPAKTIHAKNYAMADLITLLSAFAGRGPGMDKTGLTGHYDFTLSWDEENGPSLSTALQKLGLKMESAKVPIPYFVVDSAQKPSAN